MHPTPEQLAALDRFRLRQGRKWKALLRFAWGSGIYPGGADSGYLQQLRNQFGPKWLIAYRPGDTCVAWLKLHKTQVITGSSQMVVENRDERWAIVQDDGMQISGWFARKVDARRAAQADGITLIENLNES